MTKPRKLNYNTLDVFTAIAFKGNPLGLVHLKDDELSQEEKQKLAIEFNYSETVFLHHPRHTSNGDSAAIYNAQIFTPKSELPFAGHPTIGTALWIFENLELDASEVTLNLKAGPAIARYDRTRGIATCSIPHEVRIHRDRSCISWDRVVKCQPGLAAASESSGLTHVLMPIVSPVRGMNFVLVDLTPQPDLLNVVVPTENDIGRPSDLDSDFNDGILFANIFYYSLPDGTDGVIRLRQRMMGIGLEDPATGSASVTLGAYLALQKGGLGASYKFEIDQGIEMGRASKIFVEIILSQDGQRVEKIFLSGQAVEVMSGTIVFGEHR